MKTIKELYKIFEKNLLVYVDVPKPEMKYAAFETGEPETRAIDWKAMGDTKPKKGSEFTQKRKKAKDLIKKIKFRPEDQEDKSELEFHIKTEFDELEHNYQERLKVVGKKSEKATQAKEALNVDVDNFLFEVDLHALQLNYEMESDQTETETAKQTELRVNFLRNNFLKGVSKEFIRYFITNNELKPKIDKLFGETGQKTNDAFKQKIEELFNDSDLVDKATKALIDKAPRFNVNTKAKERILGEMVDASIEKADTEGDLDLALTANIGGAHKKQLVNTLAKRFFIKFVNDEPSNEPEYFVDLMGNNRIYKPNTEIDKALRRICDSSDFSTPDDLTRYNDEEIAPAETALTELHTELQHGDWSIGDAEVTGLDTIKENDKLTELIASIKRVENHEHGIDAPITEALAKFNLQKGNETTTGIGPRVVDESMESYLDSARKSLRVSKVKATPGLAGSLAAIIKMLKEAFGAKDEDTASSITSDLENGKNPEVERELAEANYETLLNTKKPKNISKLLSAYFNPTSTGANEIFSGEGVETRYKKERAKAIEAYLEGEHGLGMEITKMEKGGATNEYVVSLKRTPGEEPITINIKGKVASQVLTAEEAKIFPKSFGILGADTGLTIVKLKSGIATELQSPQQLAAAVREAREGQREAVNMERDFKVALRALAKGPMNKSVYKRGAYLRNIIEGIEGKGKGPKFSDAKIALKMKKAGVRNSIPHKKAQQKLNDLRAEHIIANYDTTYADKLAGLIVEPKTPGNKQLALAYQKAKKARTSTVAAR